MRKIAVAVTLTVLVLPPLFAQDEEPGGEVQIPLELYNQLVESARQPPRLPRPVPASYALGSAQVTVTVGGDEGRLTGEARVTLTIEVLEAEWALVPILPAGTPVESATVNGANVQLITAPWGLAWGTNKAGAYTMALAYRVDAARSEGGYTLAVPVPQAAAIGLTATLPGTGLDVAVIPSAGTRTAASGNTTRVTATVPTTSGVQISWRTPGLRGHALSRAAYQGTLSGDAVAWTGTLTVELFSDETLTLPLLPRSATLSQLRVDGEDAAILVEGDRFATLVRGRGRHTVTVGFEVRVERGDGPPRVGMEIPAVPVSRFELTLPGKKEVTVTPASNVALETRDNATRATAHVAMTNRVVLTWAEAVPEEIRTEVRANAGLYHAVWAEEGVLYVRVLVDYVLTRGETNAVRLEIPPEVQVNRISSPSGAVADWRIGSVDGGRREATVFLDRQVSGRLVLDVLYDRSLGAAAEAGQVDVPLVQVIGAQRQRGMVALLASQDLTLSPVLEDTATRVGENQLPAFVRQQVAKTIAHTYKYLVDDPDLEVQAAAPERKQGKFDAQVDTLISLGEVSLKGSASVELDVKSGRIMALRLALPAGVNLLSLTGPSIRNHTLTAEEDEQRIEVQFTQEMEGQFRLEVAYEQILGDGEAELVVPTLAVRGAEVEQGRLAVEALSAVEVQPATVAQLTALDVNELPQQLILRTTNPILMAYKYVHAEPPYRLGLTVTRHEVLGVLDAAIDEAQYRTLFTKDGLAVTTARFLVRNSREQFLRVGLPEGSEVWSVFVDGRPEKPAQAAAEDHQNEVLIKIIHSTEGFPVELIYTMPSARIGAFLGAVGGELPWPDILVTRSRWDVYLPAGVRYLEPKTNMEVVASRAPVTTEVLEAEQERLAAGARQAIEPLRLQVPTSGTHYAFEKLYANQSAGEAAYFEIPYASGAGSSAGWLVSLAGTAAVWLGVALALRRRSRRELWLAVAAVAAGVVIIALMVARYQVGTSAVVVGSILAVVGLGLVYGRPMWKRYGGTGRGREAVAPDPPGEESAEPGAGGEATGEADPQPPPGGGALLPGGG